MLKEIRGVKIDEYGTVYLSSGKKASQNKDRYGYLYITINKKHYKVHRLVAEAFIDNPEHKPIVDHIDRNRTNNHYKNLRWVTCKENSNNTETIKHLKKIGERYKTTYGKSVKSKDGKTYISIIEAARQTNIPRSNIQYHLKNNTGEWRYA